MRWIERMFEGFLWNCRFVVLTAVIGSLLAAFAIFYITSIDVITLFQHAMHYADSGLTEVERKALHDGTISHVVEVVDGYLLSTVMLIFSLGMYELFISDIDQAHGKNAASKILLINSLDDLKSRLAKVILMILIVTLFKEAMYMELSTPLDLVYLGGSITLVSLALYFSHAADHTPHVVEKDSGGNSDSNKSGH